MAWPNDRSKAIGAAGFTVSEKELPGVPGDGSQQRANPSTWIRRICINLWLWELLSLMVSATCIGAITLIMKRCDNKPIPTWSYGLTLNGVVSILAVVTKASMILPVAETISQLKWCWFWQQPRPVRDFESFDGASRGPWGSLTMLVSVRWCSLGAVGAILTVAAMAIEPTLQQLPAYRTRIVAADEPAIGRSINFAARTIVEGSSGISLSEGAKAATYLGIFGSEETASYIPPCTTGNCTWPTFSSLGVCSACENQSSLLVQSDGYGPGTYWTVTDRRGNKLMTPSSRAESMFRQAWCSGGSAPDEYSVSRPTPPCHC